MCIVLLPSYLLVVLFGILAISPDPVWLEGVYDGGDYDDVLDICTHVVEPVADLPQPVSLHRSLGRDERIIDPALYLSGTSPRAPPVA